MEKKYEKLYEKIKLLRGKETMNQITQIIKEAYPDAVVALMGGTFYNVYGKDAVIV